MAIKKFLLFCFLAFAHSAFANTSDCKCDCSGIPVQRKSFPEGFLFGAASSAYQTEGAWNRDGKGPSIWDTFTHNYPERISDGSTGDLAIDGYDLYKRDVHIASDLDLDVYRFSISWTRILPTGQLSDGVNQLGIDYYNNLINALLDKGVDPCVTIFHWDVPQALENLYGGFLSPRIVEDYRNYAELLFKSFGDRVGTWITFNEPWSFSREGYATGMLPPGRCNTWANPSCLGGDEGIEPYLVMHHQLLAHAATVDLYKKKYQEHQHGFIGITVVGQWFLPFRAGNEDDMKAAQTQLDFIFGWVMDPITSGDYPAVMREKVGDRLPTFTKEQTQKLKGSFDFLGWNYYTTQFVHSYDKSYIQPYPSYLTDSGVNVTLVDSNGDPCGLGPAGDSWLQIYPVGIKDLLNYTTVTYGNPKILITENGVCTNDSLTKDESIHDKIRVDYLEEHLCCVLLAIKECKVNVAGYIEWSLFDNFELTAGYKDRFGIYYVDFENGLEITEKDSAKWYKSAISHSPAASHVREFPSSINNRKILPAAI